MNQIGPFLDNVGRQVFGQTVDRTRDEASWRAANEIERQTFGRVFGAIQGAFGLVMLFGCFLISGATASSTFLTYLCGGVWLLVFVVIFGVLSRFQHSLFLRVRGIINNFLGGGEQS